jgi:hypothetical protein
LALFVFSLASASALHGQSLYGVAPSGRGSTEVVLTLVDSVARAAAQPSKIRIDFGQPALRGRRLFSDSLVPYDKPWRTGANGVSLFTTDLDLIMSIPSRTGWKLLIQKNAGQGPLDYTPENDLARIDMRVSQMASPLESLTMWLIPSNQAGKPHGELRMAWGTTAVSTDWVLR